MLTKKEEEKKKKKKFEEGSSFYGTCVSEDVESYLLNKKFSDVTFLVGSNLTPIYAHKFLLAAASPVLAGMLFPNKFEKHKSHSNDPMIVELPDVLVDHFKVLLEVIYTSQVNVDMINIDDYLALSRRYCLLPLQLACLNFLDEELSEGNVWEAYDKAPERLGVVNFGLDFIIPNLKKLIKHEEFSQLRQHRLLCLLQTEGLKIKECNLFIALFAWAQAQVENSSDDEADSDDICLIIPHIKPLLPHVRFPLFSTVDFIANVATRGILDEDEELELLCYITANEIKPKLDPSLLPKTKWNTNRRVESSNFAFIWAKHGAASIIQNQGLTHNSTRSSYSCSLSDESMMPGTGKYYWEIKVLNCMSGSWNCGVGIGTAALNLNSYISSGSYGWAYMHQGCRNHQSGGSSDTYGGRYGTGDTIGVLFDSDDGILTFYLNGKNLGVAFRDIKCEVFPASHVNSTARVEIVEDCMPPDDM